VPNYKSFLVTKAERKHVRRCTQFQQHGDPSYHQVFLPARQGTEGNSRLLTEILREHALSYATIKNWVAQSNIAIFPPVMRLILETVTTPEIIDQTHKLILEDCQISAKSIAEQLGISREQV